MHVNQRVDAAYDAQCTDQHGRTGGRNARGTRAPGLVARRALGEVELHRNLQTGNWTTQKRRGGEWNRPGFKRGSEENSRVRRGGANHIAAAKTRREEFVGPAG